MGRWRDSWAARNPSVRLAWPMPQTRLPLWFRVTESLALMEVLPDMAAASAGSAGYSFTRGSLWRILPRDVQKRHESLKQRRCSAKQSRGDAEKTWRSSYDRHHLAPLRHLSLFGESPARAWLQGPCLGIGRASRHHAETESDGADGRLSQDAGSADWRGHLLRQPVDHARTRAPVPHSELLSRRPRRSRRACLVGREDNLQPGCQHRVREETRRVA